MAEDGKAPKITIVLRDSDGNETKMALREDTTFAKIMKAYAESKGVDPTAYRMMHDDNVLKPGDTPRSRGLEMMDMVSVVLAHTGGGR